MGRRWRRCGCSGGRLRWGGVGEAWWREDAVVLGRRGRFEFGEEVFFREWEGRGYAIVDGVGRVGGTLEGGDSNSARRQILRIPQCFTRTRTLAK